MSENEYVLYQLGDTLKGGGLELENLPVPVRAGRADAVFGPDEVHLDLLLDELFEFLCDNPGRVAEYASFAGKLAYLVGVEMAGLRQVEAAAHYLGIGVKLNPGNLTLVSAHAVALHVLGCHEEALGEYEAVLADEDAGPCPLLRILAARCCLELGLFARGNALLESLVPMGVNDPGFVEFAAEMGRRAGLEAETPADDKQQADIDALLAAVRDDGERYCTECGAPAEAGARFCTGCGRPHGSPGGQGTAVRASAP